MFSVRAVVSLLLASQARAFSRPALRPLRAAAKPCRSPPVRAVDLYDVGGTQVTFDAVNAFPVLSIVVLVGVANAVYMSLPDEQFDSLTAPLGDPFKKERPAGGDAEEGPLLARRPRSRVERARRGRRSRARRSGSLELLRWNYVRYVGIQGVKNERTFWYHLGAHVCPRRPAQKAHHRDRHHQGSSRS